MSDQGHVSVHGDDTPEGEVVGSDLAALSPEAVESQDFTRRSPGSGLTESDVAVRNQAEADEAARRAEVMAADERPDFADAPALAENQAAAHPDDRPHPQGGKSLVEVAREVLDNKWGSGQERRMRLDDAGYDHAEVDAEIVKLLNPEPETQPEPNVEDDGVTEDPEENQ